MNLISQIFFAIFVTMSTGTVAFGIWWGVRRICMRWLPRLPYLLLRMVCLLYILPICYIWMQLVLHDGYVQVVGGWQMNFAPVGELCNLFAVIVTGWIFLTGRQIRVCLFAWVELRKCDKCNVPEEDAAVLAEFARVKQKLHIQKEVGLYRNAHITSPQVHGILRCRVVLPMQCYSREQLSVIFHHELMHCKSVDLFYKFCSRCIGILYHVEALSATLESLLDEWSEYDCDMRAITAICDEMGAARYFEIIVETVENSPGYRDVNHVFSGLYESQLRLERRIDYMKKYKNIKKATNGVSVLLAFVFVIASVTTVYAASDKAAKLHSELYQSEEITDKEQTQTEELEELYMAAGEDDTYENLEYANPEAEVVMPTLSADELVSINNWSVSPGTRKVSTSFYVKSGQIISISATAVPTSSTYWIGIMDPGNNVRYVEGTGALGHDFAISKSGFYRILIQNRSDVTITASGSYCYSSGN